MSVSLKEAWAMSWPPTDAMAKFVKDEQTNESIIHALGWIAVSLPNSFAFAPEQTVKGFSSLWKMSKGISLDEAQKNAAFALALQQAAAAKNRADAIDNNTTNPLPLPSKRQMQIVDIARREVADRYSLEPKDWKEINGLTDNQTADFHPDANAFYNQAITWAENAKAAAAGSANALRFIQQKVVAGSVDTTPNLQDIAIKTLQTLILGKHPSDSHHDYFKIAETLGIPMPKEAMDAAMEYHLKAAEQKNLERLRVAQEKKEALKRVDSKAILQTQPPVQKKTESLNKLGENILDVFSSICLWVFGAIMVIGAILWIAHQFTPPAPDDIDADPLQGTGR